MNMEQFINDLIYLTEKNILHWERCGYNYKISFLTDKDNITEVRIQKISEDATRGIKKFYWIEIKFNGHIYEKRYKESPNCVEKLYNCIEAHLKIESEKIMLKMVEEISNMVNDHKLKNFDKPN